MRNIAAWLLLPVLAGGVVIATHSRSPIPASAAAREQGESDPPLPPDIQEARFGGERFKAERAPRVADGVAISAPIWQEIGPLRMVDRGGSTAYEPSQGRINAIAADPKNPQHLYAGAASGGVWVTTDGGMTWSPRAQTLPVITISSLVVDPNDGNTVYAATGDADGRNTPTIGVYKTTDGGNTWSATGLTFQLTDFLYIPKLAIDPTNGATVYAATSANAVYYTRDGGTSWTTVKPDGGGGRFTVYRDIKVRSDSPATVYTVTDAGAVYRSTDRGATWQRATGTPDALSIQRAVIGVTAANPNLVFLLAASATDLVLYRSADGGSSFTQIPSDTLKSFASGQATFFDLALAVSPGNANELMAGVSSVYRSTDGGATWFFTSSGPSGRSNPIVHVDQHAIEYFNNSIYDCSDGGLHRSDDGGLNWPDLSPNLGVGQIYQISGSKQNASLIFVGEQDNGFNRYNGTKWEHLNAGDFGRVAVDPTNDQIVFASANYGLFKYSDTNTNPTQLQVTTEGKRFEGAPIVVNPANPQVVYAGYQNLHRSTDGGATWNKVSNFTNGQNVDVIALAPSDPKTIYVARSDGFSATGTVFRSVDEGVTFTDVSTGLPNAVTGIAIDPKNSQRLWVSLQGGSTNAVYFSQDGGSSWTNYSGTTLPNSSTRAIVYENNSQDGLYVGTLTGVYYRDSTTSDWQAYNNNLPNVIVSSLEIDYGSKKLRAGTYGRGLWQANLATSSSATAQFLNISTRLPVATGNNVLIAGFIITGTEEKQVLARGIGPSLTIANKLADPTLELHDGSGATLATNDNWKETQEAAIQATTIAPTDNLESAILRALPANNANYTAILAGKGGATGIGVVELYDLGQAANAKLANISTRGFVDNGDNRLIGGFILGPAGTGAARVVVRAIGPSLSNAGVSGALQDPTLDLRDANGVSVATNDDWRQTQEAAIQGTGIPPTDNREAAILQTLGPGAYTALVSGKNGATGIAVVEAYNLP